MTSIIYSEPELVIALNATIIFVNPNDLQIFKEISIPSDLTSIGLKPLKKSKANDDNDMEQLQNQSQIDEKASCSTQTMISDIADDVQPNQVPTAKGKHKNSKKEELQQQVKPPSIQHMCYAPNRQLFAVTTCNQKSLLLYDTSRLENAKLISLRALTRASSAIVFAPDSKSLLVTDKTGDCYQFDCVNVEAPGHLLLGHLSIVYDVIWTQDSKYIITCDRDDKIRVTNYPETYDIHGYCLGHREFVSAMMPLTDNFIISTSGDNTLRIWDYVACEEVKKFDLPAPGVRLQITHLQNGNFMAAVQLHQPQESLGIYKLSKTTENEWTIDEHEILDFGEVVVNNMCAVDDRLYVVCVGNDSLELKVFNFDGKVVEAPKNWLEMIRLQFVNNTFEKVDYSGWFKKKYDNVSEYLTRKKRRIETQNKMREVLEK